MRCPNIILVIVSYLLWFFFPFSSRPAPKTDKAYRNKTCLSLHSSRMRADPSSTPGFLFKRNMRRKGLLLLFITFGTIVGTLLFSLVLFGRYLHPLGNFNARRNFTQGLFLVLSPWVKGRSKSEFCQGKDKKGISPCLPDSCLRHDYTVWREWKACKEKQLAIMNWKSQRIAGVQDLLGNAPVEGHNTATISINDSHMNITTTPLVDDFIIENRAHLPWSMHSNFTAVLLEFRPWKQQLVFSTNNILNNLPVHWRLQILGGPSILALAQTLFPVEIAAGKIVLTDLGKDSMSQETISEMLVDPMFYEQLLGNLWLIFQYDSVICSEQRWRLKRFLEDGRQHGWWGAPWSHWQRTPEIGGNGGFSLRKKDFISTILSRFPWNGEPEDWFFCQMGADIYDELPDDLKPAPVGEGKDFASEMLYSYHPFGVHQYWTNLSPTEPQLKTMMESCPEMLGILPPNILDSNETWKDLVCSLNISTARITTAISGGSLNYEEVCGVADTTNKVDENNKQESSDKEAR